MAATSPVPERLSERVTLIRQEPTPSDQESQPNPEQALKRIDTSASTAEALAIGGRKFVRFVVSIGCALSEVGWIAIGGYQTESQEWPMIVVFLGCAIIICPRRKRGKRW